MVYEPAYWLLGVASLISATLIPGTASAQDSAPTIRIGMIGLDTSHAPAFVKLINSPTAAGNLAKMQVVAAFPGGSQDIKSSRDRVAGFTQDLRELGVEIVDSVEALLPKVDAVLLESVDGRVHLQQALPVFRAGKPMFIDKPLASQLSDAIAIDLLAKKYHAKWFSSSSLRFSPSVIQFRENPKLSSDILGATAWSPCALEPTHTDLTWYGVHGIESLYTAMGTGCQSVTRLHTSGADLVVGLWEGGRIGTFRGIRDGKSGYGLVVYGKNDITIDGKYEGYAPLVERIAEFFLSGELPVSNDETLEMFAFMQAADASKAAAGIPIQLSDVWKSALIQAQQTVAKIDP